MPSVASFAVKKDDVVHAQANDTIKRCVEMLVMKGGIGSLVVIDELDAEKVHGIITHTDVSQWYLESVPLNEAVRKVMTSHPIAVNMHMSKDEAAETMRKHKLHHLLVTDDEGKFYGLISSFDIARETALDAKAWPWPRPETHHDFIHVSGPVKSIESAEKIEEAK
ncbi:unnamed protein product [Bathycoccus prasinos]